MRQIVGALALPCPQEYFDVWQRLFKLVLGFFPEKLKVQTSSVYFCPRACFQTPKVAPIFKACLIFG